MSDPGGLLVQVASVVVVLQSPPLELLRFPPILLHLSSLLLFPLLLDAVQVLGPSPPLLRILSVVVLFSAGAPSAAVMDVAVCCGQGHGQSEGKGGRFLTFIYSLFLFLSLSIPIYLSL